MSRLAAALGLASATCTATAQTPPPAEPQRIEIQGAAQSDTDVRRRDPVARTVYGREELDKYGDISVTDVLKRLPGINLSGGSPRLRGLGAGYTLILVNGEPAPPGFSLENLPPSQVERIEVTKGPTAERSAQAVAGTINIILRAPPRQRQRELGVRLSYTALRPTGGFNALWADRLGPLSATLPFSGYQWAGRTVYLSERATRDTTGLPQALRITGADRGWGGGGTFGPRLSWKASDTLTLESQTFMQRNEFRGSGNAATQVVGGSAPLSVVDDYHNKGHWQMLRTGLQAAERLPDGARWEARVGGQASESRNVGQSLGRDGLGAQTVDRVTSSENAEQSRTTSGKFTQPLGAAHTLATGWDAELKQRRELRSVTESGVPQLQAFEGEPFYARVRRLAGFVQDEWDITPQWGGYVGVRLEAIQTTSQGSGDLLISNNQVLTPLLHVHHKLDAQGRDALRASLTRAFRAPELGWLMARPVLNNTYPSNTSNPENAPDRIGNPALKPELSTGLDLTYEHYFSGGGVASAGLFHRRIQGLIRNAITLQSVPWASQPRWVSQPVNLQDAVSTGFEFEVKGRAVELVPGLGTPSDLQVRASLSVYRSRVAGLPAPDNRLEQQQPWSVNLGLDDKRLGGRLGYGASLALTPAYATQQTPAQVQSLNAARTFDAYAGWAIDRETQLRISVGNLRPTVVVSGTQTQEPGGTLLSDRNERRGRAQWTAALSLKL
jgi:iron complex outermembrane receptor protein